jgi:PIN domain nuclease of toxin-antitoxin system
VRLLLDTHSFLWLVTGNDRLTKNALAAISDPANQVYVSLISIWEVAIKQARAKIDADAARLVEAIEAFALRRIDLAAEHILETLSLAHHHGDPFDRLLIAQAKIEGLTIVTHDDVFRPYGVPILWT